MLYYGYHDSTSAQTSPPLLGRLLSKPGRIGKTIRNVLSPVIIVTIFPANVLLFRPCLLV